MKLSNGAIHQKLYNTFLSSHKKAQPIKRYAYYTMFIFLTKTRKAESVDQLVGKIGKDPEGAFCLSRAFIFFTAS